MRHVLSLCFFLCVLTGCMFGHVLEHVGRPPEFTPPENTFNTTNIYNREVVSAPQKQYPQAL